MGTSVDERTLTWHSVATVFDTPPASAEEAMERAGLNWGVELRPLAYRNTDKEWDTYKGMHAVVRTDSDEPLGAVTKHYRTVSNAQAFEFADSLVDSGQAVFESAFELRDGKSIGLTMALPDTIMAAGDEHRPYLLLSTSHDGKGAVVGGVSMLRMACLNQFNGRLASAKNRFSMRHSTKSKVRLEHAKEALQAVLTYQSAYQEDMDKLASTKVDLNKQIDVLDRFMKKEQGITEGVAAETRNMLPIILEVSSTIPEELKGTGYGFLNGLTEYFQHFKRYRNDLSRFNSNNGGPYSKVVDRMEQHLMTLAA